MRMHEDYIRQFLFCIVPSSVGADLVCYTEVPNCKSGATLRFRQDIGTAAKQCCVGNSGMSYRITNNEGCTNCVGRYARQRSRVLLVRLPCKKRWRTGARVCDFALLSVFTLLIIYCRACFPPPPPLAVYAFFSSMADSKLLNNASIGEGDLTGLTVYFGLFKGSPPSTRKVQFKTDALNQGKVQGWYNGIVFFCFFFHYFCFHSP